MTASKLFFDTSPFIYLIENHPEFYSKTFDVMSKASGNNVQFCTSVLTFVEYCIKPEQINRLDLIVEFEDLLENLDFTIAKITINTAKIAYKLRAKYAFLKAMDALQLASAIDLNCHSFLTNDKKLEKITEIKVIILSDL